MVSDLERVTRERDSLLTALTVANAALRRANESTRTAVETAELANRTTEYWRNRAKHLATALEAERKGKRRWFR
jgi:hypothetical protein